MKFGDRLDQDARTAESHARTPIIVDEEFACKACGFEAKFCHDDMLTCEKCQQVHYCCSDCKEWDWKSGGHSTSCSRHFDKTLDQDMEESYDNTEGDDTQHSMEIESLFEQPRRPAFLMMAKTERARSASYEPKTQQQSVKNFRKDAPNTATTNRGASARSGACGSAVHVPSGKLGVFLDKNCRSPEKEQQRVKGGMMASPFLLHSENGNVVDEVDDSSVESSEVPSFANATDEEEISMAFSDIHKEDMECLNPITEENSQQISANPVTEASWRRKENYAGKGSFSSNYSKLVMEDSEIIFGGTDHSRNSVTPICPKKLGNDRASPSILGPIVSEHSLSLGGSNANDLDVSKNGVDASSHTKFKFKTFSDCGENDAVIELDYSDLSSRGSNTNQHHREVFLSSNADVIPEKNLSIRSLKEEKKGVQVKESPNCVQCTLISPPSSPTNTSALKSFREAYNGEGSTSSFGEGSTSGSGMTDCQSLKDFRDIYEAEKEEQSALSQYSGGSGSTGKGSTQLQKHLADILSNTLDSSVPNVVDEDLNDEISRLSTSPKQWKHPMDKFGLESRHSAESANESFALYGVMPMESSESESVDEALILSTQRRNSITTLKSFREAYNSDSSSSHHSVGQSASSGSINNSVAGSAYSNTLKNFRDIYEAEKDDPSVFTYYSDETGSTGKGSVQLKEQLSKLLGSSKTSVPRKFDASGDDVSLLTESISPRQSKDKLKFQPYDNSVSVSKSAEIRGFNTTTERSGSGSGSVGFDKFPEQKISNSCMPSLKQFREAYKSDSSSSHSVEQSASSESLTNASADSSALKNFREIYDAGKDEPSIFSNYSDETGSTGKGSTQLHEQLAKLLSATSSQATPSSRVSKGTTGRMMSSFVPRTLDKYENEEVSILSTSPKQRQIHMRANENISSSKNEQAEGKLLNEIPNSPNLQAAKQRNESIKNSLNNALRVYEKIYGEKAAKEAFHKLTMLKSEDLEVQTNRVMGTESFDWRRTELDTETKSRHALHLDNPSPTEIADSKTPALVGMKWRSSNLSPTTNQKSSLDEAENIHNNLEDMSIKSPKLLSEQRNHNEIRPSASTCEELFTENDDIMHSTPMDPHSRYQHYRTALLYRIESLSATSQNIVSNSLKSNCNTQQLSVSDCSSQSSTTDEAETQATGLSGSSHYESYAAEDNAKALTISNDILKKEVENSKHFLRYREELQAATVNGDLPSLKESDDSEDSISSNASNGDVDESEYDHATDNRFISNKCSFGSSSASKSDMVLRENCSSGKNQSISKVSMLQRYSQYRANLVAHRHTAENLLSADCLSASESRIDDVQSKDDTGFNSRYANSPVTRIYQKYRADLLQQNQYLDSQMDPIIAASPTFFENFTDKLLDNTEGNFRSPVGDSGRLGYGNYRVYLMEKSNNTDDLATTLDHSSVSESSIDANMSDEEEAKRADLDGSRKQNHFVADESNWPRLAESASATTLEKTAYDICEVSEAISASIASPRYAKYRVVLSTMEKETNEQVLISHSADSKNQELCTTSMLSHATEYEQYRSHLLQKPEMSSEGSGRSETAFEEEGFCTSNMHSHAQKYEQYRSSLRQRTNKTIVGSFPSELDSSNENCSLSSGSLSEPQFKKMFDGEMILSGLADAKLGKLSTIVSPDCDDTDSSSVILVRYMSYPVTSTPIVKGTSDDSPSSTDWANASISRIITETDAQATKAESKADHQVSLLSQAAIDAPIAEDSTKNDSTRISNPLSTFDSVSNTSFDLDSEYTYNASSVPVKTIKNQKLEAIHATNPKKKTCNLGAQSLQDCSKPGSICDKSLGEALNETILNEGNHFKNNKLDPPPQKTIRDTGRKKLPLSSYLSTTSSAKNPPFSSTDPLESQALLQTNQQIHPTTFIDLEAGYPALESVNLDVQSKQTQSNRNDKAVKKLLIACLLISLLALIAVAIWLGYFFGSKYNKGDASDPSPAPSSPSPSSPVTNDSKMLLNMLTFEGLANETDILKEGSPLNAAFLWLLTSSKLFSTFSEDQIIQRFSLATLYYSTDGKNWLNNSEWVTDTSECEWYTHTPSCDEQGIIRELSLPFNGLSGTLPKELSMLRGVRKIVLSGNSTNNRVIGGDIPTTIGLMSELRVLELQGNQLGGRIPTELGELAKIESLDLSMNKLTFSIPEDLGRLNSLRALDLAMNTISGELPDSLSMLSNLEHLALGHNKITGRITLRGLNRLKELYLENNKLTSLSTSIGELSNLQSLIVHENTIAGSLASEIGSLALLDRLSMHSNQMDGRIPSQLGRLQKLSQLNLSSNKFSGPIPSEIGLLSNLVSFEVQSNRLQGPLPDSLGELTSARTIRIDDNNISGDITVELCTQLRGFNPHFYLDCDELICPNDICCTHCCSDATHECKCIFEGSFLHRLCG